MFDATRDALLWLDVDKGTIIDANPAAGTLYGMPCEELQTYRLRELACEPDWIDQLLAERAAYSPLRYHRRRDGRQIPVEMNLSFPGTDEAGHCLVTVRDVSERLAVEQRRQNAERFYQGIFGAAPYAVLIIDSTRAITNANASAGTLYGVARESLRHMKLGELLEDPADAGAYALGGEGRIAPHWHRRANGERFLAEVTVSLMRGERGLRSILLIRDITEDARVNERLHASEERWRFALEGHGTGVIEWFPESDEFFFSPRFVEQLGYAEGELKNSFDTWEGLLHRDDFDRSHADILAHLTGDSEMVDMTVRLRHANGGYRWINVRGKAMTRDANGRVQRLIATTLDITDVRERRLRERRLEEQLMHTARLASMGEMATVLAHEINQPLAAIGNFTAAALRRLRNRVDDADAINALGNVVTLVERAGGIVERVRAFSRKGENRPQAMHINEVVAEIARLLEPQAQLFEAGIVLELAAGLPPINADRLQIGQLILNLAKNGLEAMADSPPPRRLVLSTRPHGENEIEIGVEDSGIGLPPQLALDVIAPFFTTKTNGLGIGLVICRTIAEHHDGRLWATPGDPQGTLFHVILPCNAP